MNKERLGQILILMNSAKQSELMLARSLMELKPDAEKKERADKAEGYLLAMRDFMELMDELE